MFHIYLRTFLIIYSTRQRSWTIKFNNKIKPNKKGTIFICRTWINKFGNLKFRRNGTDVDKLERKHFKLVL